MGMGRDWGWVVPGLLHLRKGRRLQGTVALGFWAALLALMGLRQERLARMMTGGVEGWTALATLVLALAALWWWSYRSAGKSEGSPEGSRADRGVARWMPGWGDPLASRAPVLGVVVVLAACLGALLAPILTPFDPSYQEVFQRGNLALRLAPPSTVHLFGTDQFGRDVLSRVLYGARLSLSVGFLVVGISASVGTLLGAAAGYVGGRVDSLIMRFADVVMAFPRMILLIVMAALFRPSLPLVVLALAFTQWPFATRMVRGEVLSLRRREFAEAAVALGYSRRRILFRHLLPNAGGPIIVLAALGIGNTIVLEAGLSFLGLGAGGTASWGRLIAEGMGPLVEGAWWVATFPGLALVLVVLALNLVGDGLRDALDPRQVRRLGP